MENAIKPFLDQYYPRFADYLGTEGAREETHKQRLEVKDKFQAFVRNEFQSIIARLDDEAQYQKIFEIFDLIARNSYQAGRQHYLSFFGAKRYYSY